MPTTSKKILFSKIRLHLWRWHRRIGLVSALFVMLLAITGILLNHGNRLGLDAASLPRSLLAFFYHIEAPIMASVAVDEQIVTQVSGRQLFLNANPVGECAGELRGAVAVRELVLVACSDKFLLLTPNGELVDQLAAVSGAPLPIDDIGKCGADVCWQSQSQSYVLDVDVMQWRAVDQTPVVGASAIPTPAALRETLNVQYGGDISWERWLQDLHSGRLFGAFGPWLMDIMAVLFMVLASTGVLMWSLGRRRKH